MITDTMAGAGTDDVNDSGLVAGIRAGDPEAYERVVRLYGSRLLAVARRFLRDDEEARDAVQTAFLSAFKAAATFNGEARVSTWLHRIVVNAALMRLRTKKRKQEEPLTPLLPKFKDDGHHAEPVSPWDLPDRAMEREQMRRVVRHCITLLPDSARTVVVLRDMDELSTEEVAAMLGVTPNAVKIRLHRARLALGTLIRQHLASPRQASGRVSSAESREKSATGSARCSSTRSASDTPSSISGAPERRRTLRAARVLASAAATASARTHVLSPRPW
jgi:RNA polymerase sigma-70 factor (ECF subfamily)